VGTLLAYSTHFYPERLAPLCRHPLALILTGVLLAAPTLSLSPETSPWLASIGLVGVYAGFGLVLLGVVNLPSSHMHWEKLFASRPAALLGLVGFYSYSIYLWHIDLVQIPLQKLLPHLAGAQLSAGVLWASITAVYVIAAVACGRWLAHLVERPSLRLRDRLFPSLAPAPTPPVP
jgi:peptidoglycan/LPS O-acetylase OafA/YrhL